MNNVATLPTAVVVSMLIGIGGLGFAFASYVDLQLTPIRVELARTKTDIVNVEGRIIELISQVAALESETRTLGRYVRDIDLVGSRRWVNPDDLDLENKKG